MPPDGAAVQVTDRTVPAAASRSSRAVHPGITSVRAEATLGRATLNCVVSAPVSDSPGTRNVSTEVLPGDAPSASTWTCADAVAAPVASATDMTAAVAAVVMRAREDARCMDLMWSCLRWSEGRVGQEATTTGGPRCDNDADSRRTDCRG